ncbi:MAG: DNA/RNA non-specific endonuclease [Bacteriovorax sp.]|nr:DNA/RNA non-specific endonuclease [Bacteriovorax sp.]
MKAIKKLVIIIGLQLLTISLAYSGVQIVLGNVPLDRNQNIAILPQNTNNVPEILISRDQYLLSFNKNKRLLNWAAWKIEAADLGHVGRTNSFAVDQDLENYLSKTSEHAVTPQDYQGSCFDRGHQCPSADRDDSVENNQMTFLMSNMIPQTAYLNRVIWEHLEAYTRDLVLNQGKKVYIVAGPIFDQNFGTIGLNKDIPIPSKDFKVVVILDKNQTISDINNNTQIIAVIMPNLLKSGKKPLDDKTELCSNKNLSTIPSGLATSNDWVQYKTTLSEVERLSGFKILNLK